MANLSAFRSLGAERWLPVLFAVWLLLSVITPEAVYRTFFHALIYPLTLFLLIRRDSGLVWRDPFVRLFLVFCGYMAITTWLVGTGPVEDDAQAVRWGAESALGILAFSLWMRAMVGQGVFWGRWFLLLAFTGAFVGLLTSLPQAFSGVRIEGLGVLGQAIQGASIVTIFLAIGLFLTFFDRRASGTLDLLLGAVSVVAVCLFVTLSQSRAPLISLALYLLFVAVVAFCHYRRAAAIYVFLLVSASVTGLIHWFIGLDVLLNHLLARGASYRFEIWTAYLTYLPESLFLGNGAGMDFRLTEAANLYLKPMGLDIAHTHNIWLGAFVETGLVGFAMQAGLTLLPVIATFRSRMPVFKKLHLLVIVGLFFLLTFTDEYTLLISLHPVWFIGWVPLVFVWTWSRQETFEPFIADINEDNGDGG